MIVQLVSAVVLELIVIVLLFAVAKDDIINNMKVKLRKGFGKIIVVGNDNTLRIITKRISMKKDDITTLKIGAGEYLIDPTKIFLSDRTPTWFYKEGVSAPIDPRDIHNMKGIDAETEANLLAKARLSGQLPNQDDKNMKLMLMATLVSAGASIVAVMLLMRMGGIA